MAVMVYIGRLISANYCSQAMKSNRLYTWFNNA
jgi:hypothetical protein